MLSDRSQGKGGRWMALTLGVALMLICLAALGSSRCLLVVSGYALLKLDTAVSQAELQGSLPDLVSPEPRVVEIA